MNIKAKWRILEKNRKILLYWIFVIRDSGYTQGGHRPDRPQPTPGESSEGEILSAELHHGVQQTVCSVSGEGFQ